jgi:outer membrane protein
LNVEAGDFETEKVKNDVTLNITTGYLQVLFANEVLNAALRQEETTIAQVERTRKMVDAGKLPESDLLQIEAQLATENLSVINARNQLDLANVTLMQLMEIPVTDQFEVEVPVLEEPDPLLQTSADIYNRSLQVLPQIMGAGIRTNASMMALKVTEGARWPRLNFNGSLSSNYASSRQQGTSVNPEAYPFFTQMWDNIGQSFNFSLSIPIYSQRQIRSNIDRARINLMTTQLNEQNTKNTLRKSVEQTYADLRAAGKKFEATRLQLSAVESVYLNAEKKYNIGVLSATDYLIQKNNFTQTQSSLIQAKFDYIFKRKILDFYQGKTITF